MSKITRLLLTIGVATLSLFLTACSSDTVQTASASAATPKLPVKPATTQAEAATAVESVPRSTFAIDRTSRDPFFPKANLAKVETVEPQTEIALDIPAMLQANLHGIISSGGKSIAYVSNIMLEAGRQAVIPIRAGGQTRSVNVRCREVTKDTVVLEVQGYTEPVRLTRTNQ